MSYKPSHFRSHVCLVALTLSLSFLLLYLLFSTYREKKFYPPYICFGMLRLKIPSPRPILRGAAGYCPNSSHQLIDLGPTSFLGQAAVYPQCPPPFQNDQSIAQGARTSVHSFPPAQMADQQLKIAYASCLYSKKYKLIIN